MLLVLFSWAGDLPAQMCQGEMATIVGTNGDESITGTEADDVIAALDGDDIVDGRGGNDLICGNAAFGTAKQRHKQAGCNRFDHLRV